MGIIPLNNVLFVGSTHPETTTRARYDGLKYYTDSIDVIEPTPTHTISSKIKNKFLKNYFNRLDERIIQSVKRKNYDLIWMEKPVYIRPSTLDFLKTIVPNTIFVAHITDDVSTVLKSAPNLLSILEKFKYVFTPNRFNIEEYKRINFIYNELGYNLELYPYQEYKYSERKEQIVFVGHYEKSYFEFIKLVADELKDTSTKLIIRGSGWWKIPSIFLIPNIDIRSGWISHNEVIKLYRESRMAIGLYSSLNRNLTSGRLLEYANSGIPFLSHGNSVINGMIGDNYYDSNILKNKGRLFSELCNPIKLELLSKKAHETISRNKCTWVNRIYEALSYISK